MPKAWKSRSNATAKDCCCAMDSKDRRQVEMMRVNQRQACEQIRTSSDIHWTLGLCERCTEGSKRGLPTGPQWASQIAKVSARLALIVTMAQNKAKESAI